MKEWAKSFYLSHEWEHCRAAFMISKYWMCERCTNAARIAHHKIYLTPNNIGDPEITLSWHNLEALCQDCHNREHSRSKEEVTQDGLRFNMYWDIVKEDDDYR